MTLPVYLAFVAAVLVLVAVRTFPAPAPVFDRSATTLARAPSRTLFRQGLTVAATRPQPVDRLSGGALVAAAALTATIRRGHAAAR